MFPDLPTFLFPLFAQNDPKPPDPMGMLMFILPAILLFFWFFIWRPQQKQEDRQRKMMDSLDRNDRVYTVGGIIGTVHLVDKEKNEIVLKVDDSNGTKIRFLLSAVAAKVPKDGESEPSKT